ncbi:MAG: hypothetical protein K1X28_06270 [Parachlamydiales bacterium]|nr:hypothetical protein [Parachlamydiales bacterium]
MAVVTRSDLDQRILREQQFAHKDTTVDELCGDMIKTVGDIKHVSQSELGFHPDSVLSAGYGMVYSHHMSEPVVRGKNFIAVRLAPVDNYELTHAKVDFVYVRISGNKVHLAKLGNEMTSEDVTDFFNLAKGEKVKGWQKI